MPQAVRDKFSAYGLCADEFAAFGHMPPQLYVRISNRIVSDFVLTQNNLAAPRARPDSIGVGDWSLDEHMTGKCEAAGGRTSQAGPRTRQRRPSPVLMHDTEQSPHHAH